jgi:hypothetical protein
MREAARGETKLPMHIGVKNPYALAEAKLKERIDWKTLTQSGRDEVFRRAFSSPLKTLFDPAQRLISPVYACRSTDVCPPLDWTNLTPPWFYQDDFHYRDPVQGVVCDCYFIAALSSVAWTCRSGVIKQDELTKPGYYTILLCDDTASPPVTVSIGVSKKLPVSNNNLVCAHSSTDNETWPSHYEKAYAPFFKNLGNNPASYLIDTVSQDVFSCLCNGGNPLASLFHITKPWGFTKKTAKFPATDYADPTSMWTDINNLTIGRKTKCPMVAWTYDDAATAAKNLNMSKQDWLNKWADYAGDGIVPSHSYSIFGTYQEAISKKMYVVLRNPFGPDPGDPLIQQLYTGSWPYTIRYYKAGGNLNPSLGPALGETSPLDLSKPKDGIFALEAEAFRAYFAAFGWVV